MQRWNAFFVVLFLSGALAGCQKSTAEAKLASPASASVSAGAPLAASFPGRDPSLRWDSAGNLQVLYVVDGKDGAEIVYRRLGAEPLGPVAVSPAAAPERGPIAGEEVPPALETLPNGALLAAYPVAQPGHWKSEIKAQTSADRGKTWSPPQLIHPPRLGSHSLLSSATTPGGAVFAWLDNRSGEMGLSLSSTADGRSFTSGPSLDPQTCQCCGTTLLAGKKGEVWLAYRDLEAGDVRDFRVLTSRSFPPSFDKGAPLSADGWKLQGCPDTGARLAEAQDGTLWAAWFTAGGEPGVYVTSSPDGGGSFAARTRVSDPGRPARHPEIGVLPDGGVAVLYETAETIVAKVRGRDGTWGPAQPIAPQGTYPRFAASADRAVIAFSRRTGEKESVVVQDWPGRH
jgi:hypothetical protein